MRHKEVVLIVCHHGSMYVQALATNFQGEAESVFSGSFF